MAIISDAISTSVLPRNWLPRKRSVSECIFRTLMVRLFRQNALLLSDSTSEGIYHSLFKCFTQMGISVVLIFEFFRGPVARVLALYCNPDHLFSLRRLCLQSPHCSGLYIPYRGCRAAGKDPSTVDSTGSLVLLTRYDTSILHRAASIVACCSITNIGEYNDIWSSVWMQLNTDMGID